MTWFPTNKTRRIPVRWMASTNCAIPIRNKRPIRDRAANPLYSTNLLCEACAPEIGSEPVRGRVCSSER